MATLMHLNRKYIKLNYLTKSPLKLFLFNLINDLSHFILQLSFSEFLPFLTSRPKTQMGEMSERITRDKYFSDGDSKLPNSNPGLEP